MTKVVSIVGCGWLGLPLAQSLIQEGYLVKGSTTQESKLGDLKAHGITPYILKADGSHVNCSNESLFECDVLYINIPPGRRREDVESKYPQEIQAILKMAQTYAIEHIIFISSTSVYPVVSAYINETVHTNPATASGRALVEAELIISTVSTRYTILRFAGLVGPNRNPGTWFQGKLNIPNGNCPVNMVHLEDCIDISQMMINSNEIGSDTYNVCADLHPTREDFYRIQSQKIGLDAPSFIKSCNSKRRISNEKLKRRFNYTYIHPDPLLF